MKRIHLVFMIFISSIVSCNFSHLGGKPGISMHIYESKKREVFIAEYTVPQNPYVINDSLSIYVEEAWLEKEWFYPSDLDKTDIWDDHGYRLCVNTNEQSIQNYWYTWMIGDSLKRLFRADNRKSLSTLLDMIPKDTEVFKVRNGGYDITVKIEDMETIGEFVLVKKE